MSLTSWDRYQKSYKTMFEASENQKGRILVADDMKFNIMAIRHFLVNMFGLSPSDFTCVSDGAQAIETYKDSWKQRGRKGWKPYKLLLLDYVMPYHNGMEVAMEVRDLFKHM